MAVSGNGSFCGGQFWDLDAFWNTDQPQLTNCFRHSVMVFVPCGFLWIVCLAKCCFRYSGAAYALGRPSPFTAISIIKWILSLVLIICSVLELIYIVNTDGSPTKVPSVNYASVVVRLLTFMLALAQQEKQKREGQMNSFTLSFFWFIFFFCNILTSPVFDLMINALDQHTDQRLFTLGSIQTCVIFIQMILSFFTDPQYSRFFKANQDDYVIEHQPIMSRLLFWWVNRILWFGYRNIVGLEDLDRLNPAQKTKPMYERLERQWVKEERKRLNKELVPLSKSLEESTEPETPTNGCLCFGGPSLCLALAKALWPWLLAATVLDFIYDLLEIVPALILDLIIQFMSNDEPNWHGYIYAFLLFFMAGFAILFLVHDLHFLICASIVPRSGLKAAIYRKTLKLSSGARRKYTLGELCNLVAVDTQRIFDLVWMVNLVWSAPIRIILNVALLWQYLGIACLSGIAVMILIMPMTGYLARWTHRLQESQMELKDSRLKHMSEILNGIKVLKLFAWEFPFMEQVSGIRRKEAVTIKKLAFLNGGIVFLWICAPFMVAVSSFATYVLIDDKNVLTPSIAFVSLTLFNNLRSSMQFVPQTVAQIVQSRIAFRRIADFLLSEELKPDVIQKESSLKNAIEVDRASFSWTDREEPFLRDVTVSVPQGSLVAVVGQVGSGKSALLSAILGEMHVVQGKVKVKKENKIAYVAQQAWIQNASVKQNILFLRDMDQKRYEDALDKCCLRADLKVLPGGDLTEIGEKGVNLSGGQKQRVSLARALYQDSDVYLLDDPLSAVDAHVGAHLFKHVIGPEGALRTKTRVLVTHDFSILSETDAILLMVDGKIKEMGTYKELKDKQGEFARFVDEHLSKLKASELEKSTSSTDEQLEVSEGLGAEDLKKQMRRLASRLSKQMSAVEDQPKKKAVQLIEEEKMEIGKVKASVFIAYFRNATFSLSLLMILGFAAYECFEVGSNIWLSQWSSDQPLPDGSQDIEQRNLRMGIYGLLGLGQGLSVLAAGLVLAVASTKASVKFHKSMMWSVLRSPMEFFETTPIGRILNRFGSDINTVDVIIPSTLNTTCTVIASVIGAVVVIAINQPFFIMLMIPLSIAFLFFQVFYISTSRQIRRLESVTQSPVLSFFSETVQGGSTIRAFDAQEQFIGKEDNLVETNTRVFFASSVVNRYGAVGLQMIGSLTILIVALFGVSQRHSLNAAVVGLTLSYALNMTNILVSLVRQMTVIETQMISVERIEEYSDLTSEASWKTECQLTLTNWPSAGAVSFRDYKMRYRTGMDLVLKGVTVDIAAGEKIGVVGRTGAGKTSLALALFRMVEAAGGTILIDGVDISILGLHDLRSKLTVIPQDPVVFSGTLRINLDPLSEHTDDKLWTALEHSHLKGFVATLDGGLDYEVSEGGDNLSVGQRQQLCLARALLKETKILVLDEATAAVDLETDRLIQNTIRKEFDQCTIITIAHRLHTILDYDRVLVMDDGKIVEEGHPDSLLQDSESLFHTLGKAAGLL